MEDRRTFIPQEPLLRRPHGAIPGRTWRTEHPVPGTPPPPLHYITISGG